MNTILFLVATFALVCFVSCADIYFSAADQSSFQFSTIPVFNEQLRQVRENPALCGRKTSTACTLVALQKQIDNQVVKPGDTLWYIGTAAPTVKQVTLSNLNGAANNYILVKNTVKGKVMGDGVGLQIHKSSYVELFDLVIQNNQLTLNLCHHINVNNLYTVSRQTYDHGISISTSTDFLLVDPVILLSGLWYDTTHLPQCIYSSFDSRGYIRGSISATNCKVPVRGQSTVMYEPNVKSNAGGAAALPIAGNYASKLNAVEECPILPNTTATSVKESLMGKSTSTKKSVIECTYKNKSKLSNLAFCPASRPKLGANGFYACE